MRNSVALAPSKSGMLTVPSSGIGIQKVNSVNAILPNVGVSSLVIVVLV